MLLPCFRLEVVQFFVVQACINHALCFTLDYVDLWIDHLRKNLVKHLRVLGQVLLCVSEMLDVPHKFTLHHDGCFVWISCPFLFGLLLLVMVLLHLYLLLLLDPVLDLELAFEAALHAALP